MFRRIIQIAILLTLACAPAVAQRGPGGGGPPGGGGMGPGGPGGGMGGGLRPEFGRMPPRPDFGGGVATAPSAPALAPPGRWWNDRHVSKSLNLRDDQQRKMDDIFNANKSQLVGALNNLRSEEQRLMSMPAADLNDETKVFAAIDRVAQARAELAKQNAHVLLQMRKELDPDQLAKLDHEIGAR